MKAVHPAAANMGAHRSCESQGLGWAQQGHKCHHNRCSCSPCVPSGPHQRQGCCCLLHLREDDVPVDVPGSALVPDLPPEVGRGQSSEP